jgi:cytochrome c oxidase subunit IV
MDHSPSHDLSRQVKVYICVFIGLLVGTLLTVTLYYLHFANVTVAITIALFIATVKAFLVAGFFMHLISERKAVYAILLATGVFAAGLMYLTVYAHSETPHGTVFYGNQSTTGTGTSKPSQ